MIRYEYTSNKIFQTVVQKTEIGDYEELYEPVSDKRILEFLRLRERLGSVSPIEKLWLRKLKASTLPLTPNLSEPEYLPTQCYKFLKVLKKYFPRHRLCLSDFYMLPESIEGINAPVVQTRYQGTMIPCSTYLVQPGWFDIFFPTDFELMQKIYNDAHRDDESRTSEVVTQRDFMLKYSNQLPFTRTRSGGNPMLEFYENMKFILTDFK
jgi:hypothetical protein